MKFLKYLTLIFVGWVVLYSCATVSKTGRKYDYSGLTKTEIKVHKDVEKLLADNLSGRINSGIPTDVFIDSVSVNPVKQNIDISFSKALSDIPFRPSNTQKIYQAVRKYLGRRYRKYKVSVKTLDEPIQKLVPNFYRKDTLAYDTSRMPKRDTVRAVQVVRNISKPYVASNGLYNHTIALWPSHGWYYNNARDRWEWQRPRLFESVEDKLPLSFTLHYLLPMLDNAGANVFVARERDIQTHEVIVDNDSPGNKKYYIEKSTSSAKWQSGDTTGFAVGHPPYTGNTNPFHLGTYRKIRANVSGGASVSWIPKIPVAGFYAVYVSYHHNTDNVSDAHYTVYHEGRKTQFLVNQKIGGETWIYLGRFKFSAGFHPDSDKVILTNQTKGTGATITADAVRFGGGMGDIARNGKTSGRPRYLEGARYYLQFAGMPDTLVYNLHADTSDYVDDYQSRGEWVDYLKGAPDGPNRDRKVGLGIPVDLSLAFHTDAGIVGHDSTVGTLAIYSLDDVDSSRVFPDGVSRLANRDFADILQTQIVHDIRAKYDSTWNRRQLENGMYSEAARPNTSSALLELLAHQNFEDMKFAQDPKFRFTVSRAIYKAMLKYIATEYHYKYIVEPLPVTHFQAQFNENGGVTLKWQPTADSLEPTAKPSKYIVYTRVGNGDFDNGRVVTQPETTFHNIKPGEIYSFKVSAVNGGGESFPSQVLSVCKMENNHPTVLIVNGFTRVSAPEAIESKHREGFENFLDPGVADHYNISYTGPQYNFNINSRYRSNDEPGIGASHSNFETKVIEGNTFNYPYLHGKSIKNAGYSFVSTSESAVMNGNIDLGSYRYVDLILGEQKRTKPDIFEGEKDSLHDYRFKTFPQKLETDIKNYCKAGGNLFVSGAYVASDLFRNSASDSTDVAFATHVLKYKLDTNYADKQGTVFAPDSTFMPEMSHFNFNTSHNPKIYTVVAPDAIIPYKQLSHVILRYRENRFSAAVGFKGTYHVVAFGFPFETILGQKDRDITMKAILKYLK